MIFFSIPSVGQIKPETLFGQDDHFGFIQTLIGNIYVRNEVKLKCAEYYGKDNDRYWDQIITLINSIGLKCLDEQLRFISFPLLSYIAEEYDKGNHLPSKILFDYILCKWQFPHPILTHNRTSEANNLDLEICNQRKEYPTVKPYAIILMILKGLYEIDSKFAYLKNDEFYWLGYIFYKQKGKKFTNDDAKFYVAEIIKMREDGGWRKYDELKKLPQTSTHLSYPKGFLKNSSILTDDKVFYDSVDEFFIGLSAMSNVITVLDSLVNSAKQIFDFDTSISERNNLLGFRFSNYLYNPENINSWLSEVQLYRNQVDIFKSIKNSKDNFDQEANEIFKISTQLKRLATLDREKITRVRTEQYLLRNHITRNKVSADCAICNKNYPISFLATAHIKKRTHCSDEEKRDINVVMPACYLGCDKIYEEGYIVIKDGFVKANIGVKSITNDLKGFIKEIEGNSCSYYKAETEKYFKYHAAKNV